MLRLGNLNVNIEPDTFEPAMMSLPELHFLLETAGQPPIVAFSDFDPESNKKHQGIIRVRAEAVLTRLYELHELEKHKNVEWAGLEAIKDSITRYLDWHERVQEMKRRGFKRGEPSQFHWDEMGEPYKYAIGADSAECVRTEILDNGDRKAFGVKLTETAAMMMASDLSDVAPWINRGNKTQIVRNDKIEESRKGRLGTMKCTICEHTEQFLADDIGKKSGARARMGRHLRNAKTEVHRHRLLLRKTFK